MPITHTVQDGDTLIRLAHQHGFADWRTIWSRDENATLRGQRDPQRLVAGDQVFVPDKAERWMRVSADARHTFELSRPRALLRVALTDRFGDALKRDRYEVTIDGTTTWTGRTGAGDDGATPPGFVECPVPADAHTAVIRLPEHDLEWVVELGALPPTDQVSGVQAALQNLGYLGEGQLTGTLDDATKEAIGLFQSHQRLPVSLQADDATKQALEAAMFTKDEVGPIA
jgi:hypothetical protein